MAPRTSVATVESYIDKSIAGASRKASTINRRSNHRARKSVVETSSLKHVIDVVVIINVLQVGISQDVRGPGWDSLWIALECAAAAVFTCEMIALVYTHGVSYFQQTLNIIDFIVLLLSIADILLLWTSQSRKEFGVVQLVRVLRLVRIVKLLKVFPACQCVLESMHASFITISWFIMFLGIIIYVVAIACVILFGSRATGYPKYSENAALLAAQEVNNFNNYKYFGTVWRATLTLFNLTLLNELSEILRPVNAHQPWAVVFFALFILIMTLCIMNSIVGVVVQKTVDAILRHEQNDIRTKRNQMHAVNDLTQLMFELDIDGSDQLSKEELLAGSENPALRKLLREADFPAGFTLHDLFLILDVDGSGILSKNEFVGGIFRLLHSNEFQRQCLGRLGDAQVRQCMCEIKTELISEIRYEHRLLVREIRQLFNPSGEGESFVDLEMPSDASGPIPVQTQREARLDAYKLAAENLPELRRAFEEASAGSLQSRGSAYEEDGPQSPAGAPVSNRSLSSSLPRSSRSSRQARGSAFEEDGSQSPSGAPLANCRSFSSSCSQRHGQEDSENELREEGSPEIENDEASIPMSIRTELPMASTIPTNLMSGQQSNAWAHFSPQES